MARERKIVDDEIKVKAIIDLRAGMPIEEVSKKHDVKKSYIADWAEGKKFQRYSEFFPDTQTRFPETSHSDSRRRRRGRKTSTANSGFRPLWTGAGNQSLEERVARLEAIVEKQKNHLGQLALNAIF